MIKNYIRIAWRNILKGKLYALINMSGLALAFCIALFLLLVAYNQLSFDSFHKDGDRIYQTYFQHTNQDGVSKSGEMPLPLLPALQQRIPGVESAARVLTGTKTTIGYQGRYFEELLTYTDPAFFSVFSFPLQQGNQHSVLSEPRQIVLSASLAKIIFGKEEAIGKTVQAGRTGSQVNYVVSGIVADCPQNSSIRFDALANIETYPNYAADATNWHADNHAAFVKLAAHADPAQVEENLKQFSKTYFPEENEQANNRNAASLLVKLQPLHDIHFDSQVSGGKGAPLPVIYAIIGLAVFILLIACFNFINLNIARSFGRAKEVGVRKTLGGRRFQIIIQLWLEALIVCLLGFAAGFLLALVLIPGFNARFDTRITLSAFYEPGFIAIMAFVFLLVTIVAGGYPAIRMAGFNLVETLKGKTSMGRKSFSRSGMIVFQFAIASLLICLSLIAVKQINFLRNLPTGFQEKLVYSIPVGNREDGNKLFTLFSNRMQSDPGISSISGSGFNIGKGRDRVTARNITSFEINGNKVATDWMHIDAAFLPTLCIPVTSGRNFNPAFPGDLDHKVIITQSMATALGENGQVGKYFGADSASADFQVIGIVPDFKLYAASMQQLPVTMYLSANEQVNYILIKFSGERLQQTLQHIKTAWASLAPGTLFNGSFLDENIDAWYSTENTLSAVFGMAAGIAVFLSCMGLFAISLLMIELRTKEIGIRLVMGAGAKRIVWMLSVYFLRLICLALAIALPLAFIVVKQWLQNYSQRIEPGATEFLISTTGILLIAILTISYQSVKAALVKPVTALRTE